MITILYVYLFIAAISAVFTGLMIMHGESFDKVDTFWDWIIYNLFWGLQLIKAIIKQLK